MLISEHKKINIKSLNHLQIILNLFPTIENNRGFYGKKFVLHYSKIYKGPAEELDGKVIDVKTVETNDTQKVFEEYQIAISKGKLTTCDLYYETSNSTLLKRMLTNDCNIYEEPKTFNEKQNVFLATLEKVAKEYGEKTPRDKSNGVHEPCFFKHPNIYSLSNYHTNIENNGAVELTHEELLTVFLTMDYIFVPVFDVAHRFLYVLFFVDQPLKNKVKLFYATGKEIKTKRLIVNLNNYESPISYSYNTSDIKDRQALAFINYAWRDSILSNELEKLFYVYPTV